MIISSAKHEQLNYDGSVNIMPNYIIANENGVDKILNFQISNESSQSRIMEIIDKFGSFYFNAIPVFINGKLKRYFKLFGIPSLFSYFSLRLCCVNCFIIIFTLIRDKLVHIFLVIVNLLIILMRKK